VATVLLTGASGFLGAHLLLELRAAGADVRALSRRPESDAAIAGLGGIPVRGDVTDPGSLRQAMRGVEAVFHAAADTNTWTPHNAAQTRTNVGGAQNLLAAAKEAGVGAFLHTSSIATYSHLVKGVLREDVPQRGLESWINYERTKMQAELDVRQSGLPFVVFQPAHILGPGDRHNWATLILLIDQGKLPGAPPGLGSFADVREIAKAQVRAWQRGRFGETYLFGGPHASFLDLIHKVGAQLGRKTPGRAMPAWLMMAYAHVVDGVSRVTRRQPELTPEAAAFTCHELRVDSGKAIRELDYRETDLDPLLGDMIAWMRAEGMLRRTVA
jgi:dihydroflavonol-4-reductase